MAELLVGPMLRFVDKTSATIFVETDAPCLVRINHASAATFSVFGHHYALVIVEHLTPGSTTEYSVDLDGIERWPPPHYQFPASVIRTLGNGNHPLRLLFGSCRAAAPHEPPWSLSATESAQGLGVDALRAHGLRMLHQPPSAWPDLLVFVGDQIYADEPSPRTLEVIRSRGKSPDGAPEIALGFEDYATLYQEAWAADVERWVLSTVPSTMIFDDHEMIDDWNISAEWVRDMRRRPWWIEHVRGCLTSYFIYQHLGNLAPAVIHTEGLLARLRAGGDVDEMFRDWAVKSDRLTPIEGGYRFSYVRDFGNTRLVVIDCRNARTFEPERAMIEPHEWAWVADACRAPVDHLFLVTSIPVLVTGGIHGLQIWNAAVCAGSWGRPAAWLAERLRRGLDLEDWPAFGSSFTQLIQLIRDLASGTASAAGTEPPATIAILSGDIHFSYVAAASFPETSPDHSRVYQLVSSPIRNTLARRQRRAMQFAVSRTGRTVGRLLHRSVGGTPTTATWTVTHGPEFANELAALSIDGRQLAFTLERARPDDNGNPILEEVVRTAL